MPELRFEDHIYQVDDLDTVLNTLLKNGHAIPNFCRGGYCHSCMMKAEEGMPLPFSQIGLAKELVAENYFLTCQCAVYAPMKISRPDKDKRTKFVAMVREKTYLSEHVVEIILAPDYDFVYQSGQYSTLINIDGLACDYPIASVHGEDPLMVFHVLNNPENLLSQYIFSELEIGDGLEIMTALGESYYSEKYIEQSLLITAIDLNLSSAYSFIKKSLLENHEQVITLCFKLAKIPELYLEDKLIGLECEYTNFTFKNNGIDIECSNLSEDITVINFNDIGGE